jgi:hypothetical protein
MNEANRVHVANCMAPQSRRRQAIRINLKPSNIANVGIERSDLNEENSRKKINQSPVQTNSDRAQRTTQAKGIEIAEICRINDTGPRQRAEASVY